MLIHQNSVNTARVVVIIFQEKRRVAMTNKYINNLIAYRTAMSLAKSMLSRYIITEGDYLKINKIIAEKYGVNSCSIYR